MKETYLLVATEISPARKKMKLRMELKKKVKKTIEINREIMCKIFPFFAGGEFVSI